MKLSVLIFAFVFISLNLQAREIIQAKICKKDLQLRIMLIRKNKTKFTTVLYKQSEELISGRFDTEEQALEALATIEESFVQLEWKCQAITAEYLSL